MRKAIILILMVGCIGAAFWLYKLKFDTRRVELRVQQLDHLIEKAENDIAVLRAEWNFLTRPERVELLAKKHLRMKPAGSDQYRTLLDLERAGGAAAPAVRK